MNSNFTKFMRLIIYLVKCCIKKQMKIWIYAILGVTCEVFQNMCAKMKGLFHSSHKNIILQVEITKHHVIAYLYYM